MKHAFIAVVAPIAVKLRKEGSCIFPSVRVAQALLETGGALHSWNNLVGFKCGNGKPNTYWKGRSVGTKTWEVYDGVRVDGVQANWRAYDCIEDCFRDQDILFEWNRYDRVRDAQTAQEQTNALYICGYATDPGYAGKLMNLIRDYGLEKYDEEANEPMLKPWVYETIHGTWLEPAYEEAKQKGDQETMDNMKLLAKELRAAAGIPEE